MGIDNNLTKKLEKSKIDMQNIGLYRTRNCISNLDKNCNFSSNDYLSLSNHPTIKKAYQDGFSKYSVGSSGSVVISGYHKPHRDLEKYFAKILEVDDCLLFSSGYTANLSVVSLLAKHEASLVIDKSVHASIYDGIKLSNANFDRFLHNDILSLRKKLKFQTTQVILTESIFSMSGQIAPLADIAKITNENNANLIVDEAHGFGVIGRQGLGGVVNFGLGQDDVPLRIIPFGKAVGACGAIVAGNGIWIEELLQMRPAVYSTSISPAYAYGLLKAIEFICNSDDRRNKLSELISYFKDKIRLSSLKWRDSETPIQQLQYGCPHKAVATAEKLLASSIVCFPIRQPTVSKDETGLRVILNYHHEVEDIDL